MDTKCQECNQELCICDSLHFIDELENAGIESPAPGLKPWGNYKILTEGNRYKVKIITVKPGQELSLQKHFHRAEVWVVVQGCGTGLSGPDMNHLDDFIISEGELIHIEVDEVHNIKNPGKIDLIFIEVQTGPYLEEDDIVRLEDKYGRVEE